MNVVFHTCTLYLQTDCEQVEVCGRRTGKKEGEGEIVGQKPDKSGSKVDLKLSNLRKFVV